MKKLCYLLFSFLIINIGMSEIDAADITLENIKNSLTNSSVMQQYGTTAIVNNNELIIKNDSIFISFLYSNNELSYSDNSSEMALYLLNQSNMSRDEFYSRSSKNMMLASEVVAIVANLYGYNGYHGDWIGHMMMSDYINNGIEYNLGSSPDGVAYLYKLKVNLNGTFESYLRSNYEQSLQSQTPSVVIPPTVENVPSVQEQTPIQDNTVHEENDIIHEEDEEVDVHEEKNVDSQPSNDIMNNLTYIAIGVSLIIVFLFLFRKSLFIS